MFCTSPRHRRSRLSGRLLLAVGLPLAAGAMWGGIHLAAARTAVISWTQRGSYAGAEFTSLISPAGFPGIIALTALQPGGLAVSTDFGENFASLFPLDSYSVTAKDSQTGYVAAGAQGVVKTTDGGANWFQVNVGLPGPLDARAVLVSIPYPDSVFAGLYGGGVFSGGPNAIDPAQVTWTAINEGLLDLNVRTVARVRGGSFMIAATQSGLWRRTNNLWTLVAPGVVASRIVIDSADSNLVYAASETGVWKSTNQGLSFATSSAGLPVGVPVNDIARRTDVANVLYVGTRGSGVYETTDYGSTWHPFGPALPGENDARAVICTADPSDNTARMFAGTRTDGLFEAMYTTPAEPMTWGKLKSHYVRN